jgi:2-dehydropantoate 2-reductase
MAKVAVIGVGAIGSVIAALLQEAGHEVMLCVRRSLSGLVVETPDGAVVVKAQVLTDPGKATPVDWVLISTKAYDVQGAAKWLERLCAGGAPVAVLQNGVEHRERFEPYVPEGSIVPVIVDCPVERRGPGDVHQRGAMQLKVQRGNRGAEFVGLFAGTKAEAMEVEDFVTVAWRKLCHNVVGVLPTLVLRPTEVLQGDEMGEVARGLVRECVAVGRAQGARLDDDVPEAVLKAYRAGPGDSINSLHADRIAGRPMEIDARNGVVVRLGRKHGLPTPGNEMAVALLRAMTEPLS